MATLPSSLPPTGFRAALGAMLNGSMSFELHCQPIVDLSRGTVAGFEALARFPEAIGVSPDRCISFADALGQRLELEELLAQRGFELRHQLPPNTFLSINISPALLLSERWPGLIRDAGSLAGVVIEITEGDAILDYSAVRRELDFVRRAGGLLAVDDTGAGYASLKHVMELRPNFIKLDRLFIENCAHEPVKRVLIELLGETADRLDAWVIAEGVETELELDEILRLDIPLAQGQFLGHPAARMQQFAQNRAAHVHSRRGAIVNTASLYRHAELCPSVRTLEQAAGMLHATPGLFAVAVLDAWERPVELMERHPLVGVRRVPTLMRVQAASAPREVLTRALTRSTAECYDSMAAVDENGRFQGILRVDRLMCAVLMEDDVSARGREFTGVSMLQ